MARLVLQHAVGPAKHDTLNIINVYLLYNPAQTDGKTPGYLLISALHGKQDIVSSSNGALIGFILRAVHLALIGVSLPVRQCSHEPDMIYNGTGIPEDATTNCMREEWAVNGWLPAVRNVSRDFTQNEPKGIDSSWLSEKSLKAVAVKQQ